MVDVRSAHGEFFQSGFTSWTSPCHGQTIQGPADWPNLPDKINKHLTECPACRASVVKGFTGNL